MNETLTFLPFNLSAAFFHVLHLHNAFESSRLLAQRATMVADIYIHLHKSTFTDIYINLHLHNAFESSRLLAQRATMVFFGGWRGFKEWAEGWVVGWAEREGKGGCGFSSLMKQKEKGENYAVFCFAGKRKIFFDIYDVITSPEKEKSSVIYYSPHCAHVSPHLSKKKRGRQHWHTHTVLLSRCTQSNMYTYKASKTYN